MSIAEQLLFDSGRVLNYTAPDHKWCAQPQGAAAATLES